MNTEHKDTFAIVPDALIATTKINWSSKAVLIHCLSKYRIDVNGKPYTFSCAGISKATGLSLRTIERTVPELTQAGIIKRCGTLINHKTEYPIFTFNQDALDTFLYQKSSNDKLSCVKPLETLKEPNIEGLSNDTSNDKLPPSDDNLSVYKEDIKSKILEVIKEDIEKEYSTNQLSTSGNLNWADFEATASQAFPKTIILPITSSGIPISFSFNNPSSSFNQDVQRMKEQNPKPNLDYYNSTRFN
jgi:hypothetical protein